MRQELATLEPQARDLRARVALLRRGRTLSNLRQRLDAPLDDRPLRAEIAARQAELQSLDLSGVAALEREVVRLREVADRERRAEQQAIEERARLTERMPRLEDDIRHARADQSEREQQADAMRARFRQASPLPRSGWPSGSRSLISPIHFATPKIRRATTRRVPQTSCSG